MCALDHYHFIFINNRQIKSICSSDRPPHRPPLLPKYCHYTEIVFGADCAPAFVHHIYGVTLLREEKAMKNKTHQLSLIVIIFQLIIMSGHFLHIIYLLRHTTSRVAVARALSAQLFIT